jgi:hypothetical protein
MALWRKYLGAIKRLKNFIRIEKEFKFSFGDSE